MQPRPYEITFADQAGSLLRAEFDDCEISVGPGTTTLHAGLIDQGALQGLLQRIASLGLELIDVRIATRHMRNDTGFLRTSARGSQEAPVSGAASRSGLT